MPALCFSLLPPCLRIYEFSHSFFLYFACKSQEFLIAAIPGIVRWTSPLQVQPSQWVTARQSFAALLWAENASVNELKILFSSVVGERIGRAAPIRQCQQSENPTAALCAASTAYMPTTATTATCHEVKTCED
eukprot:s466_g2.t1